MAWYNSSWSHRATVEIDATYVDEAVPIIPVYLSGFDSTWWSAVAADGDDIIVTQSDGTTVLEYYIVSIDTGGSTGLIIVNVDGYISASSNVTLYVYVGNAGATAASDAAATFADYAAYYLPGMTTTDLTGNGYDLTAVNSPGTAASFEGLTAATYAAASSQYHQHAGAITAAWPLSMAMILTPSSTALQYAGALTVYTSSDNIFGLYTNSGGVTGAVLGNGGSVASATQSSAVSNGTTDLLMVTRNGTSGTSYIYDNSGSASNATTVNAFGSADRLTIGALAKASSTLLYFSGSVSQLEMSASVRSADYFTTMYDAWFTSAFRTYGATEAQPSGGDTGWVEFSSAAQVASTAIWTTPSNALTSLVTYASASPGEDEQTYLLDLTDAAALSGVSGTITSAEVEVVVTGEDTGTDEIQDNQVQFVYAGSTIGTNQGRSTQIDDVSQHTLIYTMDNPTAAQATASTFGVRLQYTNVGTDGAAEVRVYRVRVRIQYSDGGAPTSGFFGLLE